MLKKRLSIEDAARLEGEKRKKVINNKEQFEKEGWKVIDLLKYSLSFRNPHISSEHPFPIMKNRRKTSAYEIFKMFITPELLTNIIQGRKTENPNCFLKHLGKGRFRDMTPTISNAYHVLAVRARLHSQCGTKLLLPEALNQAQSSLSQHNSSFIALNTLRLLHPIIYARFGTNEEYQLSENFNKPFDSFGDSISGDEKLFAFRGFSGFVRHVPSKPAKYGLWHFQNVVVLFRYTIIIRKDSMVAIYSIRLCLANRFHFVQKVISGRRGIIYLLRYC
jgi:hypothetical protein